MYPNSQLHANRTIFDFRNELMNLNSIVDILELEFPKVFVNQKVNLSSTIIFQSKFFRVRCKEGFFWVNPPDKITLACQCVVRIKVQSDKQQVRSYIRVVEGEAKAKNSNDPKGDVPHIPNLVINGLFGNSEHAPISAHYRPDRY